MAFTGKATYSAGATLPEIAEDVSDLVSIVSPHETPLLDALGDPARVARSTIHEWLEDALTGNRLLVASAPTSGTAVVDQIATVRVGDQLLVYGTDERVLVTAVDTVTNTITMTRSYGNTELTSIGLGTVLLNLGNAAFEGGDASAARFTNRTRQTNWTQIFSATCEVSGSELAVAQIGVRDELDYQKTQRLRELLRDLENTVINGVPPAGTRQGSATVRRSMRGIMSYLGDNPIVAGENGMPDAGDGITETVLNAALRVLWERSSSNIDLILVGGQEKRAINGFVANNRRFYTSNESFKDMVSTYESDFGVARVVLSRYVPAGNVLLLDSSKIDVLPLAGRSFHYKPLATTGDRESGQLIGEYTLEMRGVASHGLLTGLFEA